MNKKSNNSVASKSVHLLSKSNRGLFYNNRSSNLGSNNKFPPSNTDNSAYDTDIELEPDSIFVDTESDMNSTSSNKKTKIRKRFNNNSKPPFHTENVPTLEGEEKPIHTKMTTFKTRTIWTLILIFSFFVIISAGHVYCSLLVCGIIVAIYREIIFLRRKREDHLKLPQYFFLRWYWFAITIVYVGLPWLVKHQPRSDPIGSTILNYHSLGTFLSAFVGLVWFILSLRKYTLRYQFSQLAIMLLTLLYVVIQSLMYIENIYHGLIWFILPTSLVIINDVFAYIFGVTLGKTQLIKLSPRKTVEGYLGASVVTVICSIFLTWKLQNFKVMICPQEYINFVPFSMWWETDCIPNKSFLPINFELPNILKILFSRSSITLTPIILHSIPIGLFAAFCAPFGGFFASAFKRAIRIKDFGDSIPGHGGITDRFDCQILMGIFTYFYISTFVFYNPIHPTASSILSDLLNLSTSDQIIIFYKLFDELKNKQVLLDLENFIET